MTSTSPASAGSGQLLLLIQNAIALVLLGAVIWFVHSHWPEVLQTVATASGGQWSWLILAVIAEGLFFLALTRSYLGIFRLVGIQLAEPTVLGALIGAQTLGVFTPTELLAEQAIFYRVTKQSGQSGPHIALGVILAQLANLTAFLLVFALGILSLSIFHGLAWYELLATYILLLLLALLLTIGFLMVRDPLVATRTLEGLRRWIRAVARFLHWRRLDISDSRIVRSQQAVSRAVTMLQNRPEQRTRILLYGLAGHLLRILCLAFVLASLGLTVAPWQVVTTYAIGTLIWIISPLPQGIGLVEGAYAIVLTSLGFSPGVATSVSLIYRGITFWLPFFIGILFLPRGAVQTAE